MEITYIFTYNCFSRVPIILIVIPSKEIHTNIFGVCYIICKIQDNHFSSTYTGSFLTYNTNKYYLFVIIICSNLKLSLFNCIFKLTQFMHQHPSNNFDIALLTSIFIKLAACYGVKAKTTTDNITYINFGLKFLIFTKI